MGNNKFEKMWKVLLMFGLLAVIAEAQTKAVVKMGEK